MPTLKARSEHIGARFELSPMDMVARCSGTGEVVALRSGHVTVRETCLGVHLLFEGDVSMSAHLSYKQLAFYVTELFGDSESFLRRHALHMYESGGVGVFLHTRKPGDACMSEDAVSVYMHMRNIVCGKPELVWITRFRHESTESPEEWELYRVPEVGGKVLFTTDLVQQLARFLAEPKYAPDWVETLTGEAKASLQVKRPCYLQGTHDVFFLREKCEKEPWDGPETKMMYTQRVYGPYPEPRCVRVLVGGREVVIPATVYSLSLNCEGYVTVFVDTDEFRGTVEAPRDPNLVPASLVLREVGKLKDMEGDPFLFVHFELDPELLVPGARLRRENPVQCTVEDLDHAHANRVGCMLRKGGAEGNLQALKDALQRRHPSGRHFHLDRYSSVLMADVAISEWCEGLEVLLAAGSPEEPHSRVDPRVNNGRVMAAFAAAGNKECLRMILGWVSDKGEKVHPLSWGWVGAWSWEPMPYFEKRIHASKGVGSDIQKEIIDMVDKAIALKLDYKPTCGHGSVMRVVEKCQSGCRFCTPCLGVSPMLRFTVEAWKLDKAKRQEMRSASQNQVVQYAAPFEVYGAPVIEDGEPRPCFGLTPRGFGAGGPGVSADAGAGAGAGVGVGVGAGIGGPR